MGVPYRPRHAGPGRGFLRMWPVIADRITSSDAGRTSPQPKRCVHGGVDQVHDQCQHGHRTRSGARHGGGHRRTAAGRCCGQTPGRSRGAWPGGCRRGCGFRGCRVWKGRISCDLGGSARANSPPSSRAPDEIPPHCRWRQPVHGRSRAPRSGDHSHRSACLCVPAGL